MSTQVLESQTEGNVVENNVLSNNTYSITRVVNRTTTYPVPDEENEGQFKQQSFTTTDVSVSEEGLLYMNDLGENVPVKRISFNPAYFTARLMLIPAMDLYWKCEHKLVELDEFYKELGIVIEQSVHAAGDEIPDTNGKTYSSSGIANQIVKFVPSALAKAELKRVAYLTAHMAAKATAQSKVVKALMAKRAEDTIAKLDALDALDALDNNNEDAALALAVETEALAAETANAEQVAPTIPVEAVPQA